MKEKDPKYNLMLVMAMIIVLAFDIFFVSNKEGYHMDEILSYELSNSEFTPWITPIQPEGRLEKYYRAEIYSDSFPTLVSNLFSQAADIIRNRGGSVAANYKADVYDSPQWMSSRDMASYVTYYGNDSVIALSAYYNTTTDNHPPFYFMLLNVVSAVYALFHYGTLSVWPGCFINIVFMMGSMFVISSFFKNVAGKKYMGPVAALFYGLSPAGINTILLIRMYGAVAFFCLAFMYLVLKKIADGADFKKGNKKIILVTVLGFLTQYFACIWFFFIILTVSVYLLCSKKGKQFLYLMRTMLISAVWGIGLYPFVFHDVFGTTIGDSVRENLTSLSGYLEKLRSFASITAVSTGWSKGGTFITMLFVAASGLIAIFAKKMRFYGPVLFFSTIGYILTVSKLAPYTVDRYMMPVFPMVIIVEIMGLGFAIYFMAMTFLKDEKFRIGIYASVLTIWSVFCIGLVVVIEPDYLYTGYYDQLRISDYYSSYDAVVVYSGTSFYRNVPELMNYQNCILLTEDEIESFDERIGTLDGLIVIEAEDTDKEYVIRKLGSMYGYTSLTVLMDDGVYGDRVCLLSK